MDTDIAHLAELETIKAQFEELRFNIEEQERAWKGSIIERRQIVPRVFTSQESEFLAIQESDIASKARQELIRVKALQMVQVTTKAKDESHIAAELTMRIAESKAKFVRQGSFIEAGPKFLRHGFCLFGRVLHLSVIVEECFAVFSEQNTAELWHMPAQGEETLAEVVQIIAAGVTFVAEMSNTYYPDPTHKGKIAPDPPKTSTDNYAMRNTISLEWFKNAAATYTVMGIPAECPPLTRK